MPDTDLKPGLCMYEKGDDRAAQAFTLPPPEAQGTQDAAEISPAETQARSRTPVEAPPIPVESSVMPVEGPTPAETEPPSTDAGKKAVSESLKKARPFQARVAWAWITTFIEVKHDKSSVAYDVDNDSNLICPPTDNAMDTRAQIIKYVAEIFARQHRQFVFAALIVRRRAFLMRWDRAGAIVATPFDYIDELEKLLRFVYRIALAERSAQGYDPTASLASKADIERFKAHRNALSRDLGPQSVLLEYIDDVLSKENLELYPIYKVCAPISLSSVRNSHSLAEQLICEDTETLRATTTESSAAKPPDAEHSTTAPPDLEHLATTEPYPEPLNTTPPAPTTNEANDPTNSPNDTPRTHAFLVGAPRHCTRSPTGRGGKGFVAYDLDRDQCSFLKDYWYAISDSVHPETEVYQRLNATGVRYVATLVAGGDVGRSPDSKQETLTQNYLPEEGGPCARRHHRFVVEEIGRPLETYGVALELFDAVFRAVIGEPSHLRTSHGNSK